MSILYSPLKIKDVVIKNRIMMSPMCQYSAKDGFVNDWHMVHYGSRAVGDVGLIMMEATAVTPNGRITYGDLGLWDDVFIPKLSHICDFLKSFDCIPGIQLAHAGRKASSRLPKDGEGPLSSGEQSWDIIAPSSLPFDDTCQIPKELTICGIHNIQEAFGNAALRALKAGFKIIEIHAAHGYLIHEFLSPLTNFRKDEYGGSFENRIRFLLEIINIVKQVWPDNYPLFVRISATDFVEGGWDINQSILLSKKLSSLGVDVIDVSSGGIQPDVKIPVDYGYQLGFATKIHNEANIKTATVGMYTSTEEAEIILNNNLSDIVAFGRELLRNPYFALKPGVRFKDAQEWPTQYLRAKL